MPAQRKYHASVGSGAPAVSPTFSAGWTDQTKATRRKWIDTVDNSVEVNETKIGTTTNGERVLSYQFVGDPVGAGSSGAGATFRAQFLAQVGAVRLYYPEVRVFMWDPVGGAVRCVLVELASNGTQIPTTFQNRIFADASFACANVSWSAGDIPVLEVGFEQRTTLSGQNVRIKHGAPTALTDLGSNETDGTGRSWSEFSFTFPSNVSSTDFSGGVTFAHPSMSSTETETENLAGGTTFAHPVLAATMAETLEYSAALTFGHPALAATLEESFLLTGGLTIGHPALDGTFTVSGTTPPVTPTGRSGRRRVPLWIPPIDDDEDAVVAWIAAHRRPF